MPSLLSRRRQALTPIAPQAWTPGHESVPSSARSGKPGKVPSLPSMRASTPALKTVTKSSTTHRSSQTTHHPGTGHTRSSSAALPRSSTSHHRSVSGDHRSAQAAQHRSGSTSAHAQHKSSSALPPQGHSRSKPSSAALPHAAAPVTTVTETSSHSEKTKIQHATHPHLSTSSKKSSSHHRSQSTSALKTVVQESWTSTKTYNHPQGSGPQPAHTLGNGYRFPGTPSGHGMYTAGVGNGTPATGAAYISGLGSGVPAQGAYTGRLGIPAIGQGAYADLGSAPSTASLSPASAYGLKRQQSRVIDERGHLTPGQVLRRTERRVSFQLPTSVESDSDSSGTDVPYRHQQQQQRYSMPPTPYPPQTQHQQQHHGQYHQQPAQHSFGHTAFAPTPYPRFADYERAPAAHGVNPVSPYLPHGHLASVTHRTVYYEQPPQGGGYGVAYPPQAHRRPF